MMKRLSLIPLAILLLLAACQSQTAPTEQPTAPPGTFQPALRDQPTLPPPVWTEGGAQITVANAPQLAYLGRLDALGTPSTVFAYSFSPDGTRLAGLNNEQLIVWDLITGQIVFNTARLGATLVYFSPDKDRVYTLDAQGTIRLVDAETGAEQETLPGKPDFNAVTAFYADTGLLALGGLDGQVKVWDVGARQSLVTIEAHRLQITALAFSPDGERLATSSDDGALKIWNWRERQVLAEAASPALRLAFSPDGAQIAAGEAERITLWNTADGTLQRTLTTGPGAVTDVMTYAPTAGLLLNGGAIPAMTLWDTVTGLLVNTLPGVGGDVTTAAFSPNGELLITATLGRDVSLWDVNSLRESTLTRADLNVGTRQILYADWSPDGFLLAFFDATGPIHLWGIPRPPEPTATPTS
jgi:WD40 repeat protein